MFPCKKTVIFLSIIITSHIILPSINNNRSVKTIVNKVDWNNEKEKESFQQLSWIDESLTQHVHVIPKAQATRALQLSDLKSQIDALKPLIEALQAEGIENTAKNKELIQALQAGIEERKKRNAIIDDSCTIS